MIAAFATNTTVGVRPISSVDDITFPADHPILTELQDEYLKIPTESL
jgi:branched-subunit amino acid aminotransferase/4-amino-4-deoxychorismate lyase